MLIYRYFSTREYLRDNSKTLFVFGDNFVRQGFGGQAKEMRDEPNAVGIITKKYPSMNSSAFLQNSDYDVWFAESLDDLERLRNHHGQIVWPTRGIGTKLAQLQIRAPRIWREIENFRLELERKK